MNINQIYNEDSYIVKKKEEYKKKVGKSRKLQRLAKKIKSLNLLDIAVLEHFLFSWGMYFFRYGYVSISLDQMYEKINRVLHKNTIRKSYKKLVNMNILIPVWFEKGGNVATRYIIDIEYIELLIISQKKTKIPVSIEGSLYETFKDKNGFFFEKRDKFKKKQYTQFDEKTRNCVASILSDLYELNDKIDYLTIQLLYPYIYTLCSFYAQKIK